MSKKEKSIRMSKKHGFQPTMPLCYYCGKEKGTIMLLGENGDKLARELGHEDGEMPMRAWLPGDIEPCDECRERGVGIVEVTDGRMLTGRRWLVSDEAVKLIVSDEEQRKRILERRVMLVSPEVVDKLGLAEASEE